MSDQPIADVTQAQGGEPKKILYTWKDLLPYVLIPLIFVLFGSIFLRVKEPNLPGPSAPLEVVGLDPDYLGHKVTHPTLLLVNHGRVRWQDSMADLAKRLEGGLPFTVQGERLASGEIRVGGFPALSFQAMASWFILFGFALLMGLIFYPLWPYERTDAKGKTHFCMDLPPEIRRVLTLRVLIVEGLLLVAMGFFWRWFVGRSALFWLLLIPYALIALACFRFKRTLALMPAFVALAIGVLFLCRACFIYVPRGAAEQPQKVQAEVLCYRLFERASGGGAGGRLGRPGRSTGRRVVLREHETLVRFDDQGQTHYGVVFLPTGRTPRTLTLCYFPQARFADRLKLVPEEFQANDNRFAVMLVIGLIFCMLSPIAALVIRQWQRDKTPPEASFLPARTDPPTGSRRVDYRVAQS